MLLRSMLRLDGRVALGCAGRGSAIGFGGHLTSSKGGCRHCVPRSTPISRRLDTTQGACRQAACRTEYPRTPQAARAAGICGGGL